MKIVFLLFNKFTALDVAGPYEVLKELPNAQILFVGLEKTEYKDTRGMRICADYCIDDINQADVLLIPGGTGIDSLLSNKKILDWIREIDRTTEWTTSVCSGSILLAEAGLLNGKDCTTHWKRKAQLSKYNVSIKDERYIHTGKIITSAGVSAGIDMALYLASKIAGDQIAQMIQLSIEYDPNPPFNCGSPSKAPKEIIDKLKK